MTGRGNGLAVEPRRTDFSEPGGPGFESSYISAAAGRRSSALHDHAELLSSTDSLVLCAAWLVTWHCMTCALRRLGQLSPLQLTSGIPNDSE